MLAGGRRPAAPSVVVAAGVALLLLLPVAGMAPSPHARGTATALFASAEPATNGSSYAWTNGVIRLDFASASPAFTLSSVSRPSVSVQQSLGGLAEVNAEGKIQSFASFVLPGLRWNVTPTIGTSSTAVDFEAQIPVLAASGDWESGDDNGGNSSPIGNVSAEIAFSFNASTGPDPGTVAYSLNVSDWPWLSASDALGVEVRSNISASVGYWQLTRANTLTELSRTDATPLAAFVWSSSALTRYSGGGEDESSVGAYHNFSGGGSSSLLRLNFTNVPGNYSTLSYDPWLEILSPGALGTELAAWVLTPLSIGTLAVGVAVAVGFAALARRRRVPPESDL